VSLGQSNNTGKAVDIEDMDYFVSSDARLGGTTDKWIALGTQSHNRDYYELWAVINWNIWFGGKYAGAPLPGQLSGRMLSSDTNSGPGNSSGRSRGSSSRVR